MENLTNAEALAKIKELEARLKKVSGGSGAAAKTEEDFLTPDRCHFEPGSLRKADDGNKNVVTALCMLEKSDGAHTLTRDFRPVFRKPSPRAGEVMEALALDQGTTVCGTQMVKATSDLHHSFYCPDCKSEANSKRRESRGAYNTKVKDALVTEISELRKLIDSQEDDIDLD